MVKADVTILSNSELYEHVETLKQTLQKWFNEPESEKRNQRIREIETEIQEANFVYFSRELTFM
jgi:hypothetical protein